MNNLNLYIIYFATSEAFVSEYENINSFEVFKKWIGDIIDNNENFEIIIINELNEINIKQIRSALFSTIDVEGYSFEINEEEYNYLKSIGY